MIEKFLKRSKTFCIMPFVHINQKQDNVVGACCRSLPVGNLEKESIEEIWNNKNMKRIRRQLLNNEMPDECRNCWKIEESGAKSYRMKINYEPSLERKFCDHINELDEKTMSMPFKVPFTEIRLSNKCNLHCRMCNPRFSSNWERSWNTDKELREFMERNAKGSFNSYNLKSKIENGDTKIKDKLLKFVKDNAPYIKGLALAGGEVILQDEHYELLNILKPYAKNITLNYSTNLTCLGNGKDSIFNHWGNFKKIELKVSVDGDPYIYPYIRRNANVDILLKNLKKVMDTFDNEKIRLTLTCTTSVYNVERLPEAISWFTELGGWAHTSLVLYPEFLSVQVLPKKLKRKITEKINTFLSDLETNINWEAHPFWQDDFKKENQKKRIKDCVLNCINFMNGQDANEKWKIFLGFNDIISKKENSILDVYPEWEEYIN